MHESVMGSQPLEGDASAGRSQCDSTLLGNVLTLQLPGGSGQLVALSVDGGYYGRGEFFHYLRAETTVV